MYEIKCIFIKDPPLRKRNPYSRDLEAILYTKNDFTHFKAGINQEISTCIKHFIKIDDEGQIRCIRCSPDGKHLACGDQAGILYIYDIENHHCIKRIEVSQYSLLVRLTILKY